MKKIKSVKGMGTIYDGSSELSPSGGVINLQLFVEHIPVVPNRPGVQDFKDLARVLRAQGLSLQTATDREGNVCLYTPLNRLCWQAKGANSVSAGCEHMHMTITEDWTKRQLRASAWLWVYARDKYGIPAKMGRMGSGPGIVRVKRKGHVTHKQVSIRAGFRDRSDPGPKYDVAYVMHCVKFYDKHHHFEGA
jgi:hypothetical protein